MPEVRTARKTKSMVRVRAGEPHSNLYLVVFANGRIVVDARGMTRDDAIADARRRMEREDADSARGLAVIRTPWVATLAEYLSRTEGSGPLKAERVSTHRQAVRKAILDGLAVHPKALEDHPDMFPETQGICTA